MRLVENEDFYIVGTDLRKYYLELNDKIDKRYVLPPAEHPEYLEKLNKLIKAERVDFLYTHSEQEVWFVAHNKEKVKAKTLSPDPSTIAITYNKAKLNAFLAERGIDVPKSFLISNRSELKKALDILLKENNRVWLRAIRGGGSKAALPVNTLLQAEGWIDYWIRLRGLKYSDFQVCEFLPGKEFAFQSIWWKGKIICSMARERVEYLFGNLFPSGQSSSPSVARTVHRDDVNELATRAIKAVAPKATGVFCVDIKENKDGFPCITEINVGRFFTTSINFSVCGVNMPYYYILLGLGEKDSLMSLPKYNGIPAGWYWIRLTDMGYKLVKGENWTSKKI